MGLWIHLRTEERNGASRQFVTYHLGEDGEEFARVPYEVHRSFRVEVDEAIWAAVLAGREYEKKNKNVSY